MEFSNPNCHNKRYYQKHKSRCNAGQKVEITEEHELFALSLPETLNLWLTLQVDEGELSQLEADNLWAEWKQYPEAAAKYFSATKDITIAAIVAKDLGKSVGKVRYNTYGGKVHVIFKGNQKLRRLLTGTKYGVSNPKIVSLGIGMSGARAAARKGGILSIVLISAFNVTEFILNDQMTLADFVGQMTSDIVKVAAATAIGVAVGAAVAGTALVSAVAIGPLLAVVGVTILAGFALDYIDKKFQLTEKLKIALNASFNAAQNKFDAAKQAAKNGIIDLTVNILEYAAQEATSYVVRQIREGIERNLGPHRWIQLR